MELRRALLLFALVLGVAAIATSFSRPAERDEKTSSDTVPQQSTSPREEAQQPRVLSFSATGIPRTLRLPAGKPAAISVEVAQPGQVEILGLGLIAPAEPLTPARFDLLERRAGSHEVRFTPAAADGEGRAAGVLEIVR